MIVHLTRDLALLPTKGRPLSQQAGLSALWQQRAPLYAAFAGITVQNSGTLEEAAEKIEKELNTR